LSESKPKGRPEKVEKPEVPSGVDYKRWLKYLGIIIIALVVLSKLRGGKVEAPPEKAEAPATAVTEPTTPQPSGTEVARPIESAAEAPAVPFVRGKTNTLPEVVSIKLTPKLVYPGTMIKAEIEGRDADDDPVTFYREWKKNDEALPGEILDDLDTKGFKKGDLITLYVAPFDGKENGKRKWSPTIMIANRPPQITSSPPTAISNSYIYEVKASDPDGDKLTFSLEGAPPGMTIDPTIGRIEWNVPSLSELKSDMVYNVKVIASDGDANAFQGYELRLTK
jgi:hypothetical protein